jgi:hypothetical protein
MAFGDRSVSGIATGVSDLFAAQGELSRVRGQGLIGAQGLITEAGYQEEAQRGGGSQIAFALESQRFVRRRQSVPVIDCFSNSRHNS